MTDFTPVAAKYERTSTAQRSAGARLIELLDVARGDDVLDLGCGPGHLTAELRALTDGVVVGVDPSSGMIAEARRLEAPGLEFHVGGGESLDMPGRFDAIFCNSAFQWFRGPQLALAHCLAALRPGGRMAVQAPARRDYCPNFVRAFDALGRDERTRETYGRFRSPWLFLETAEEYADLFTAAGFTVVSAAIEGEGQRCPPEKAFEVFESGAAVGYLSPLCYDAEWPADYLDAARELIARDFRAQAGPDGEIALRFNRIYVLARKP